MPGIFPNRPRAHELVSTSPLPQGLFGSPSGGIPEKTALIGNQAIAPDFFPRDPGFRHERKKKGGAHSGPLDHQPQGFQRKAGENDSALARRERKVSSVTHFLPTSEIGKLGIAHIFF